MCTGRVGRNSLFPTAVGMGAGEDAEASSDAYESLSLQHAWPLSSSRKPKFQTIPFPCHGCAGQRGGEFKDCWVIVVPVWKAKSKNSMLLPCWCGDPALVAGLISLLLSGYRKETVSTWLLTIIIFPMIFSAVFGVFHLLLKLFLRWWQRRETLSGDGRHQSRTGKLLTCLYFVFLHLSFTSSRSTGRHAVSRYSRRPKLWMLLYVPDVKNWADSRSNGGWWIVSVTGKTWASLEENYSGHGVLCYCFGCNWFLFMLMCGAGWGSLVPVENTGWM